MYKRKNMKIMIGAFIGLGTIIIVSLVYAGFTGQLNITGTSTARQSNWDIHFENLSNVTTTGSAKVLTQPRLNGTTSIEDYDVTVTSPSDTISFTFKVVNDGNYDAEISSLNIGTPTCTGTDETSNTNVCGKLTYSLTDENGSSVQVGDKLLAKDYKIMKVTLFYQDFSDASLLPTADVSISGLGITINYEQSGSALVKDNGEVANNRVYHQGDKITLNNEDYWIIEDSGADKDYVIALKDIALTQMAFGSTALYDESDVKKYIDNWADNYFTNDELKEIDGYAARLIKSNEYRMIASKYSWSYSFNYWMMSVCNLSANWVCGVESAAPGANRNFLSTWQANVRPVINVYKSAISS